MLKLEGFLQEHSKFQAFIMESPNIYFYFDNDYSLASLGQGR
jgi:hypothetical protein